MENIRTIKQVKAEILDFAEKNRACYEGKKRVKKATTYNGLLAIIKKHINWCVKVNLATPENLERWFEVEALRKNHIYTSMEVDIFTSDSAEVFVLGNACVNIVTLGKCQLYLNTYGNCIARITTKEDSKATIYSNENSSIKVDAYDTSKVIARSYDSSSIDFYFSSLTKIDVMKVSELSSLTINGNHK